MWTVLYYDRQGQPLTIERFLQLFRDEEYRRIGSTDLENCHVSTVWLGLDHGWGRKPPVIFETLVFGGPLDGEMNRYCTEEEARAGHEAMVQKCKDAGNRVVEV